MNGRQVVDDMREVPPARIRNHHHCGRSLVTEPHPLVQPLDGTQIKLEDAEQKKTVAEGIAETVSREKAIVEVETAKAQVQAEEVAKTQAEVSTWLAVHRHSCCIVNVIVIRDCIAIPSFIVFLPTSLHVIVLQLARPIYPKYLKSGQH